MGKGSIRVRGYGERRTTNNEIPEYGEEQCDTEQDRACEGVEVAWVAPANHGYAVLVDGVAVDLVPRAKRWRKDREGGERTKVAMLIAA